MYPIGHAKVASPPSAYEPREMYEPPLTIASSSHPGTIAVLEE